MSRSRVFNSPTVVPVQADHPAVVIQNRSVDEARPLRVVVIGAGINGILSCIRFVQRVPNIDLCIYDKNADIGGTWFENKYPGCACDIPSHTYQASFEPNKEWSAFYAPAPEIHQYWKHVVHKYGCRRYMKLKQRVLGASWDENDAKWRLEVEDVESSSKYQDQCDVLVQATGCLNNWKWPSIPGLHDFKGKIMHSADWDTEYDYTGQNIAVIGNGSSGIQVVPGTLPKVAHIDHYIRSRTWICPPFAEDVLNKHGIGADNYSFSPEELETFKNDPAAFIKFRKEVELQMQSAHEATLNGTPMQLGAIPFFTENMKRRLKNKPELLDELLPSFPPTCRRLTPGPGYLEALTDPKVDVIKSEIVKVDETGILTADGQHRPVDMIVCATGFDTSYTPRFPITGINGLSLAERWKESPETYLSIATDGFPNYFICFGPNSGLGEGNLLMLFEREIEYFAECLRKIQRDNIRTMSVKPKSVKRFTRYCDEYFKNTVYSSECRSWYKGGKEDGRVTGVWPGSSIHSMKVFSNPRWEDFEYEYLNDNPMGWIGDGWTENEKYKRINVDYLDDDQIDFPRPVVQNGTE
ncbi:uncharacterized protein N7484_001190 [Penicillium longicatenatum]|uniref:uncharacterized protein n=1 Tax=Penicillium longicatenatum TaxID=1561947 RepID=UPI002547C9BA|nr:uncharacterized protein N7484_001190 [Penicillium longicatenatum]KAJ5657541.1 hypothetical protein N7484_001190 [Penicillium longicatenatum]